MHNIEILVGFIFGTCAAWFIAEWCLRRMMSRRQRRYPVEHNLSGSDISGDQDRTLLSIRKTYLRMSIKDALVVAERLDHQTVAIHLNNALLSLSDDLD